RLGRQCLNAFRYEAERRRFHQSANSYELVGDPGRGGEGGPGRGRRGDQRRGWWKPVPLGGRGFDVTGSREDSLDRGERERGLAEDELREAEWQR
ncbi:hypothetical protein X777_06890, partial [Ooceraea biroi]